MGGDVGSGRRLVVLLVVLGQVVVAPGIGLRPRHDAGDVGIFSRGVRDGVGAAELRLFTTRRLFLLPFGTRAVVLRTLVGDATAELPLRLPDVD